MNKLVKSLIYLIIITFCLGSCNEQKKDTPKDNTVKSWGEAKAEFTSTLSSSDTSNVKKIALQCMDLLKSDSIDQALELLYTIDNGKLRKLSDKEKARLKQRFKIFPVIDYKFLGMSFATQGNNDIKFSSIFSIKGNSQNTPKSLVLMFNPIKIENQWYLTMKNIGQSSQDMENRPTDNSVAPAEITF